MHFLISRGEKGFEARRDAAWRARNACRGNCLEPCGWLKDLRFDVCLVNFCGQEIGVFESNLFYKTKKRISASPLPEGEKVMKIR